MSRSTSTRILSLDPGSQYLGYAVLDNGELLYHGVKELPGRDSPAATLAATRIAVLEIIEHLKPTVIAIETFTGGRSGQFRLQSRVVRVIQAVARRCGLTVFLYAPPTIRKFICGSGRASKRSFFLKLVRRYPELRPYLEGEHPAEAFPHGHMFDAVAVGLLAEHRLSA